MTDSIPADFPKEYRATLKRLAAAAGCSPAKYLEMVEDHLDMLAVKEALEEVEREGTIPWEEVKAELGIQ